MIKSLDTKVDHHAGISTLQNTALILPTKTIYSLGEGCFFKFLNYLMGNGMGGSSPLLSANG